MILDEIAQERARQRSKGYDQDHDDNLSLHDFFFVIRNYTGWAEQMYSMGTRDKARRRLIQIGALIVAAVEKLDRE